MRKIMIVFAIATTLASGAIGHGAAAPPVSCEKKSAPSKLTCETFFTLASSTPVTLRLLPGLGYTGTLQARIMVAETINGNPGWRSLATAAGYFAAGQPAPVTNTRTEDTRLLAAGTYRLYVESAALVTPCTSSSEGACHNPCSTSSALCAMSLPKFAAGEYSAEVVEAVA